MAEPPTKRARRTDSTAIWDRNGGGEGSMSPRPVRGTPDREEDRRVSGDKKATAHRRDERRRSTSRDRDRHERRKGERSRSRERGYRERDRERSHRDVRDGYDRRDRDRRSRSRSRERPGTKRDAPIKRERDRSRSPLRNGTSKSLRTRSPPKGPRGDRLRNDHDDDRGPRGKPDSRREPPKKSRNGDAMHVDPPNGVADEDEDAMLRRVMGFSNFNTTNNKKVPGNNIYGVRKDKKTKYRQYMNRTGGFNRPLSPSRE